MDEAELPVTQDFTLSKTYDPASFEPEITTTWTDQDVFHAVPDERGPSLCYTIMMPLPNVTGALHMGHAMDNVMQDMLIRWHRMMGDNTLWLPGTDHAGIATQAVVEKRLKELEGLTRHDVGREGLVARIWQWKDQYQARIIAQQKRMGCSADWKRQRFTMDAVCSAAVRETFFRMFEDGLIYRGKRLVNWDPYLQTSVSDDEVYHETVMGHFWHLRYPIIDAAGGEPTHVVVATTRPETMLGDTAVAVHPDPEAVLHEDLARVKAVLEVADAKARPALEAEAVELTRRLDEVLPTLLQLRDMARAGRRVMLPLMERPIPLICDEWAKPSMGSGCVKITPAHDPNDYDVWTRHKDHVDILNILNPDGSLNANAGAYEGQDRFVARERVVADLEARDLMAAVEERQHEVGHSDRSKTPIEPYYSDQWFIRMGDVPGGVVMARGTPKEHRSPGLVQAAIDAAEDGRVSFHPPRFTKTYIDWLSEKRDWPISRQLWWGHRIPVWSRTSTIGEVNALLRDEALRSLAAEPGRARVRVVQPDEDVSVLWTGGEVTIPGAAADRALIDVCLLSDDAAAIAALTDSGFVQDPDVLDTWFSSALWPHSTLGWPDPARADTEGGAPLAAEGERADTLSTYYPGSCLVTARDIITLWVARMVLTGLYNLGDIPFSDVFIHANILDGNGVRMSKSKGNGIDPVDIINEYGTDAMRYVLCDMQTGNQDIRLPVTAVCPRCDEHNDLARLKHGRSLFTYMCAGCDEEFDVLGTMPDVPAAKLISERFMDGRRFSNKLWNTARFALRYLQDVPPELVAPEALELEDRWILAELNRAVARVTSELEAYNPSNALGAAREFMWGALCDWYLELIKPRLTGDDRASGDVARRVLAYTLDQTLRLLHPFIPFITEHLYQKLQEQVPVRGIEGLTRREDAALVTVAPWPTPTPALDDDALVASFNDVQRATGAVREVRAMHQLSPSQPVEVTIRCAPEAAEELRARIHVMRHMANAKTIHVDPAATRPRGAASAVVDSLEVFVHDVVDDAVERQRLEKERDKLDKEIAGCQNKLANERFVSRAPAAVVAEQRTRLERFEAQRAALVEALAALEG